MNRESYCRENYIYACAYIRCLERTLLTREKTEKMLDGKTPGEALLALQELGYGDGPDGAAAAGFEAMLRRELEKTFGMVLAMVPQEECFAAVLYPNDYHNIKTLLKAEFLGLDADEFLVGAGSVPPARMAGLVRNRSYPEMRPPMAGGIRDAIDAYGTARDPQAIDLVLDKACYKDVNSEAFKLNNNFIKGFVALKIDTINLKAFFRVRQMGRPRDFFRAIMIEGGNVPADLFQKGFEMKAGQFSGTLEAYGLQTAALEGAAQIKEHGRFTLLELRCDNLLMKYLRDAKQINYGIEPIFAFMAARESDIRTARIIIAGKLAGLGAARIRERVRDTYA